MEMIKTFDGTQAQRIDCVKIKGQFYIKNVQCFRFNDQWYRIDNPNVFYDHENKRYQLYNEGLVFGIVDEGFRMGWFRPNIHKNCSFLNFKKFIDGPDSILVLDLNTALKNSLVFCQSKNIWGRISDFSTLGIRLDRSNNWNYATRRNYNAAPLIGEFMHVSKNLFEPTTKFVGENYKELLNYSWGIEFETNNGVIPEPLLYKHGLIPLKDGSITGHEYATVPLRGKTDLLKLNESIDVLQKYCTINNDCSLHVHIGGFNIDQATILSFYRLGCMLEKEIGDLFCKNIFNTAIYKSHAKDYCKQLTKFPYQGSVEEDFNTLYTDILGGRDFDGCLSKPHPKDNDGQHKWQVDNRYKWLNILNLCFGVNKTIEFRIHNATLNKAKIFNWMLIINAFIKFGIKNRIPIVSGKKFTLTDVLSVYNDDLKKHITAYITLRKEMKKRDEAKGDYNGHIDVDSDKRTEYKSLVF